VAARRTASAWIRSEAVGTRQVQGRLPCSKSPAGVAQQAEQPSCKRQVSGSTPLTGSAPPEIRMPSHLRRCASERSDMSASDMSASDMSAVKRPDSKVLTRNPQPGPGGHGRSRAPAVSGRASARHRKAAGRHVTPGSAVAVVICGRRRPPEHTSWPTYLTETHSCRIRARHAKDGLFCLVSELSAESSGTSVRRLSKWSCHRYQSAVHARM
jgi:hypothetical protein